MESGGTDGLGRWETSQAATDIHTPSQTPSTGLRHPSFIVVCCDSQWTHHDYVDSFETILKDYVGSF